MRRIIGEYRNPAQPSKPEDLPCTPGNYTPTEGLLGKVRKKGMQWRKKRFILFLVSLPPHFRNKQPVLSPCRAMGAIGMLFSYDAGDGMDQPATVRKHDAQDLKHRRHSRALIPISGNSIGCRGLLRDTACMHISSQSNSAAVSFEKFSGGGTMVDEGS